MSNQNALEIVREMAKLTMTSGKINPIQESNLKIYPFVFFENVSSVSISYDLSVNASVNSSKDKKSMEIEYSINKPTTDHMMVSFHIFMDDSNIEINKNELRFKAIENAVHNLFWKGIAVNVYFNETLAYSSKKGIDEPRQST